MTDAKTQSRPEQRGEHQALRQEILEDARRKARRILERTEREVKTLKEKSVEEMGKLREKVLDRARGRARERVAVIMAPLEVESRREILKRQDEVVQQVFHDALARLDDVGSYDYDAVLAGLVFSAVAQMSGQAFVVAINETGRERLSSDLLNRVAQRVRGELNRNVSFSCGSAAGLPPGVVVSTPDGRQIVDNTFPARLHRLVSDLRLEVSKVLYGETGTDHE